MVSVLPYSEKEFLCPLVLKGDYAGAYYGSFLLAKWIM